MRMSCEACEAISSLRYEPSTCTAAVVPRDPGSFCFLGWGSVDSGQTQRNMSTLVLPNTLLRSELEIPGVTNVYRGKVRDVYTLKDRRIVMVASDRLSAFDIVLPRGIPHKGQVLTSISWQMLEATRHIAPNWAVTSPDPCVIIGKHAEPIKVEVVVRRFLTGSAWRAYEKGDRLLCGIAIRNGMKQFEQFDDAPLITPSTKAPDGEHDENLTHMEVTSRDLCTSLEWDKICRYALDLFREGTRIALERGLLLVDTKYEFGRLPDGTIILIDEIHTPDSSRYWIAGGHDQRMERGEKPRELSKEFVRQWLIDEGFQGKSGDILPALSNTWIKDVSDRYIELCETITGRRFFPARDSDINNRIQEALNEYFQSEGA